MDMTEEQAIAFLTQCADRNGDHWFGGSKFEQADCPTCRGTNRAGHLGTPGSRYGRTSADCAPVAYRAACVYRDANGDEINEDLLDHLMGLTVNDSDGIEEILVDALIEDETAAPWYA
jgi:hypothetical protein